MADWREVDDDGDLAQCNAAAAADDDYDDDSSETLSRTFDFFLSAPPPPPSPPRSTVNAVSRSRKNNSWLAWKHYLNGGCQQDKTWQIFCYAYNTI